MKKKGQVSIYLTFMIVAIIIVTIASVFAPIGVRFNTEMFKAGEDILNKTRPSINDIQDESVRNSVNDVIDSAIVSGQNNIEVNSNIFKYAWVIILGLTALVVFLFSRRLVEAQGGVI